MEEYAGGKTYPLTKQEILDDLRRWDETRPVVVPIPDARRNLRWWQVAGLALLAVLWGLTRGRA